MASKWTLVEGKAASICPGARLVAALLTVIIPMVAMNVSQWDGPAALSGCCRFFACARDLLASARL
jgi:hypothetical protein